MSPSVRRKLVDAKVSDAEKRRYPSKHYVYIIQVTWDDGSSTVIFRRYSKFFDFQISLLETFPHEGGIKDPSERVIPFLPGKILFRRSNIRDVAMKRRKPIDEYCSALLLLPVHIKESDLVLDFFESKPEDLNPVKEESFSKRKRNEEVKRKTVRRTRSLDIGEISGPITLEQYSAVADYTRTQPKELSVASGQMLEVIEKNENGWWFVSDAEGERGWVPGVYLEKLDGTSENLVTKEAVEGEGEEYITTSQFSGGEGEVGFGVGVIVEVLQKNLEGWWLISYNGKQGWAPASYLERTSESVLRGRRVATWGQHRRSLPSNPPHPASSPKRSPEVKRSVAAVAAALSTNRTRPPPKRSTIRRGSMKPKGPPPLPPSPAATEPVYEYVTAATFNAQIPDGISFRENKKIKVLEKSPGDWWYIEVDGCEGWAPASYIEKQFRPPRPKPPAEKGPSATSDPEYLKPRVKKPDPEYLKPGVKKSDPVTSDPEYLNPRVKKPDPEYLKPGVKIPDPSPPDPECLKPSRGVKMLGIDSTPVTVETKPSPAKRPLPQLPGAKPAKNDPVEKTPSFKKGDKPDIIPMNRQERSPSPLRPSIQPKLSLQTRPKPNPAKPVVPAHRKTAALPNKNVNKPSISETPEPGKVDFRSVLKPVGKKPSSLPNNEVKPVKKQPYLPKQPSVVNQKPSFVAKKPSTIVTKQTTTQPSKYGQKQSQPSTVNPKQPIKPSITIPKQPSKYGSKQPSLQPSKYGPKQPINSSAIIPKQPPKYGPKQPTTQPSKYGPKQPINSSTIIPKQPSKYGPKQPATQPSKYGPKQPAKPSPIKSKVPPEKRRPALPSNKPRVEKKNANLNNNGGGGEVPGEKYVAVADFEPENENEAGFKKGAEVLLVERARNDWWFVRIGAGHGWVPAGYFELASGSADSGIIEDNRGSSEPIYSEIEGATPGGGHRVVSAFSATDESMISVAAEEVIEVLEESDTGWWFVRNGGGAEGWAPAEYLERV